MQTNLSEGESCSNKPARGDLAPQRWHEQKRDHPKKHAEQRKRDQRIIAVSPVVDQASAPGADRRSKPATDRNGAVDCTYALAPKYFHGGFWLQRAAGADTTSATQDK